MLFRSTGVSAELGLDIDGINDIIQAKKTGLQVGAYFFTQAVNEAEAIEEADFAVKALKDNGISLDLPLVIDTEYQPGFRHNYISWETRTRVVKAFRKVIIHRLIASANVIGNLSDRLRALEESWLI